MKDIDVETSQISAGIEASATAALEILKPPQRVIIRLPIRHNPKLQQIIDRVNGDDELYTLWQVANVNAVQRLGMSDHGPVHVQIVTNIALKLLRLLVDRSVQPSLVWILVPVARHR